MGKKRIVIPVAIVAILAVSCFVGLVLIGHNVGWGPFTYLVFDAHEENILNRYDPKQRQGEIVFYGASNFRLYSEMDEGMLPYVVQNHGFGRATDGDLMERANRLLHPYEPKIVVFQTGSNDYVGRNGSPEEVATSIFQRKQQMFLTFHEVLPSAEFVVMSGILMPGRSQYDETVKLVNSKLKEYAPTLDYVTYVDSEALTIGEDGIHRREYFISDGIHLTHEARLRWANECIKPALGQIIQDNDIQGVKR